MCTKVCLSIHGNFQASLLPLCDSTVFVLAYLELRNTLQNPDQEKYVVFVSFYDQEIPT